MGIYTEHWKSYKRNSVRGILYMFVVVVVGLPFTVLVALGGERLTGSYPFYLHVGLLLLWLVIFTVVAIRYSRVVSPRCHTTYSRGKWLCNGPKCGLRMLQDAP